MTSQTKPKPKPKPEGPRLWCESVATCQAAWDSTSLVDFMTCPRRYQFHMIEGWVPAKRPPTLHFGIAFHEGLAGYYQAKVDGQSHNKAIAAGLRRAWAAWGDYQSDDNCRTKFTLSRGLIWYADRYVEDPAETVVMKDGTAAVELSFRTTLPMHNPDGGQYMVCGHLDRVVKVGDVFRVSDAKTTKTTISDYYLRMYDLDVQMDLYDFAGRIVLMDEISGIMLDVMQTAVNFSRFQRAFTDRKPGQREEWMDEILFWIEQAEICAINEYWPANKTSCSKFGGCRFREVCTKEPCSRKVVLESDFKVERWNPLQSRGE